MKVVEIKDTNINKSDKQNFTCNKSNINNNSNVSSSIVNSIYLTRAKRACTDKVKNYSEYLSVSASEDEKDSSDEEFNSSSFYLNNKKDKNSKNNNKKFTKNKICNEEFRKNKTTKIKSKQITTVSEQLMNLIKKPDFNQFAINNSEKLNNWIMNKNLLILKADKIVNNTDITKLCLDHGVKKIDCLLVNFPWNQYNFEDLVSKK